MRSQLRFVAPDERIVLESGVHWAVLLRPGFAALVAIVAAGAVGFITSPLDGSTWIDVVAGGLAILFAARLAMAAARWASARFVVTGTRVVRIEGVMKRTVTSIPLERVAGLAFEQPLAGRVFDFGTVVLESGWPGRPLARLHAIPRADAFYRALTLVLRPGVGSLLEQQLPASVPPDQADTGPIPRVVL
jgi:hypothetical protein